MAVKTKAQLSLPTRVAVKMGFCGVCVWGGVKLHFNSFRQQMCCFATQMVGITIMLSAALELGGCGMWKLRPCLRDRMLFKDICFL